MTADLHGIIDRLGDYDVVLTPSYALAKEINLAAARGSAGGAFGTIATTFWAWVEGLWERCGDGRQIASDVQVSAVLSKVLSQHEGALKMRPGLPVAALHAMQAASGLDAFERAVAGERPSDLLSAEHELLDCIAQTRGELSRIGLVEQGLAVAWLAEHAGEVFAGDAPTRIALVSDAPLPPLQRQFVDACLGRGLVELTRLTLAGERLDGPAPARLVRAPEGVDLRFAFPAGAYATPQLLVRMVEDLLPDGPMVVSCADPLALYDAVAPELARRGIRVAVRGRKPWGLTSLGRAYLSLYQCLTYEYLPWDRASLADVLSSPLLHRDRGPLWRWDARVRADRLLTRDKVIADLCAEQRIFKILHDLVTKPTYDGFSLMEEALVTGSGLAPSELSEELDALGVLKGLHLVARRIGIEPKDMAKAFLPLLERAGIGVRTASFHRAIGLEPQVTICSLQQASQTVPGGCATVVALDLDSDSYPAAKKADSLSLLLDKLGVPTGEDFLDRSRRAFASLVMAPTTSLVLGRCLNDSSAEPRYHCAVLEEFVDLYRDDPTRTDDIDNDYALPAGLQEGMYTLGEEDLVADVRPGGHVPLVGSRDALDPTDATSLVSNRRAEVQPDAPLVLSPSQIETYLSCPAKWFATRRMKAAGLDEALGPREQGVFRHDILQEFYQRFQEHDCAKVTSSNRELAHEIYLDAFKDVLDRHVSGEPGARAPFLLHTTEERVVDLLRRELWNWLVRDADVLAPYTGADGRRRRFVPAAFEFGVTRGPDGPDGRGQPVEYAGALLTGRIDRIDVDQVTKRAVVFDYKGSVGSAYDLPQDKEGNPNLGKHVQALIYAHVLGREPYLLDQLGIAPCGDLPAVVGALYLSYRRGNTMRGTFVTEELSEEQFPTLVGKDCGRSAKDLATLLERLEASVAEEVVERIRAGVVDPVPRTDDACRYCPVTGCPRRR